MDRCTITYAEKDGCVTLCTREANHREACFWPQHFPHPRVMSPAITSILEEANAARRLAQADEDARFRTFSSPVGRCGGCGNCSDCCGWD